MRGAAKISKGKADNRFLKRIFFPALLPNIVVVLGEIINIFIEGILVGQKFGDIGLQAINEALPVYLILCTIGSLFAAGASYLSSIRFGKKNSEGAQRVFGATLWILFVISVVLCLAGYFASPYIAKWISNPETYELVLQNIEIVFIGGVFKTMLYISFFYLRLEGKNVKLMLSMLLMMILNVIFGYIFMFVLDLGIRGAAWASVIGTAAACIMSFCFLFIGHTNFKFKLAIPTKRDITGILKFGSSVALDNVLSAIEILTINMILDATGITSVLAIFAIINNISEFSMCVQEGVPQTASAMTGVLRGEKDSTSVKKLLKIQLFSGLCLSSILAILFSTCATPITALFGSYTDSTVAIICFSISFVIGTFNNIMAYYYNAITRTKISNLIIVLRVAILIIGFAAFANLLGEYIWVVYPGAELLTAIIFISVSFIISRKPGVSHFYLLDESFEKTGRVTSFSVNCDKKEIVEASEKISEFCSDNELDSRKTNAVALAIEEILTIISEKSLNGKGTIDVRVIISEGKGIVRIRSGGKKYNPFDVVDDGLDYLGVRMISKLASDIQYLSVLKVNTLIINI